MDFHAPMIVGDNETVPQTSPMSADQVMNSAGGFGWKVDDMVRLKRFLCLGSEGGTYYTGEKELTAENAQCIARLIENKKGEEVVNVLKQFSVEGRTAKQSPILLGLAICAKSDDLATKRRAYSVLKDICRIPTFLFEFIQKCENVKESSGWGRAHRNAVSSWYNSFKDDSLKLAMHVTKYKNRNQWTHRDVLRLSHAKPCNDAVGVILRYVVKDMKEARAMYDKPTLEEDSPVKKVLHFLAIVDKAKDCKDPEEMVGLIRQGLVREHVPTVMLSSPVIWTELLQNMPMTAMIRNLGKMSSVSILGEGSAGERIVLKKLRDERALKQARIHPFNVLVALITYTSGHGMKGKLSWDINKNVKAALNDAFYMSFKFVEPTNKRYLLAVDVSGSMGCAMMGTPGVTCRDAAAAMMMVTRRTEADSCVVAFCDHLKPLDIGAGHTLEHVHKITDRLSFGGTDCALPMIWAKEKKKMFDVFVVYTDCETYFGGIHPHEALREYRKWSGLWDARLIVCGMASNGFTIADPDDPGMLDVVGFDTAAPEVMRSFVMGDI